MPNANIKTAARNLQRAVSDIDSKQSKVKSKHDDRKRSIDQKINDIKDTQNLLKQQLAESDSPSGKASITAQLTKLDKDINDLEHRRYEVEDDSSKQVQNLESKKSEIKRVSNKLKSIA